MASGKDTSGSRRILVINPNSNRAVTDGFDAALEFLRVPGDVDIECVTLTGTPFGIESQADVEAVTLPLRDLVKARDDAGCFVIACYSDPGLYVCREATSKPVLGIQECGVLTAMSRGDRFGVIAIMDRSVRRHMRSMRRMGVIGRMAGERAVNLTVAESASGEGTFGRLVEVGAALRDQDGADTIVLGCAGMATHRAGLEAELGVPVIDPVQAAATMAVGNVLLNG